MRIDLILSPVLVYEAHGHGYGSGTWAQIKVEHIEVSRFATQRTRLNANIEFREPAA